MAPPPLVTGVSPKEGPPGTLVTVRGDFLGSGPTDLLGLTICGCDCLLSAEWKSPKKILARSGPGKGRGDIVVTTRSGGKGTSTVQFRGYHETIGPMKESAVWVEEAPLQALQALAWSRRSLSPSALTFQQEDPLGLSVEGAEARKFPEDDLHELFPGGAGDLACEAFCAGWFLLEHHSATSFDDLKAGLAFLRRKVEGHKEGQLSFLKTNVGSVMEQLDTLSVLKERLEEDLRTQGPDPTRSVEEAIQESMQEADKLFEEVLARRDRADAARNALSALQRYKFLLCLPVAIERCVRRGDYDVVINDYARATNLFGDTDVPVFRRALQEVEQRIQSFRQLLREKLKDMDSTLEEQKHIIRNLVSLDAEEDPAWDALECHATHLRARLKECQERQLQAEQAEQAASDEGKGSGRGSAKSKGSASQASLVPQAPQDAPPRVLLVEEACEALRECFPALWRLGQSYFSGELYISVRPDSDARFKQMVLGAMDHFCHLIRGAVLLPLATGKGAGGVGEVGAWLPHCLRCVRSAYAALIALDLPAEALDVIAALIAELRMHCLSTLFRQGADAVRALHQRESWRPVFESGHPGGISDLPLQFEQVVVGTLQRAQEAVGAGGAREKPLLQEVGPQREAQALAQALLMAFPQAMETLALASDSNHDDRSPSVSQLIHSPTVYRSNDKETSGPPWEQRLLVTLGNCQFTVRTVLPRLQEAFPRHGLPPPTLPVASAAAALNALDKRILEVYLEQKSDPLVGTIEPSMYLGRFDWDTCRRPWDVSPYAKELLANINAVHAEVHRVSPLLVARVLAQIVETVWEELARLMACVQCWSPQGAQQASADIALLNEATRRYASPHAQRFFDEAMEAIPPLTSQEEKNCVAAVGARARSAMRLQLLSLVAPLAADA